MKVQVLLIEVVIISKTVASFGNLHRREFRRLLETLNDAILARRQHLFDITADFHISWSEVVQNALTTLYQR